MSWCELLPLRALHTLAVLGAVLIGATLYLWGQPPICTCGEVRFWVGSVFSSGNSQHIADWYSLSHMVHGMLVVLVGRWLFPRVGLATLYLVAILTGVAWEIFEHTDFVLDRFRATTLYQGYIGDSVLNAVCDYLWMLLGFFIAHKAGQRLTLLFVVILEITSALTARDSLALTTLMVLYPVDAIEAWQQELNPNPIPEG